MYFSFVGPKTKRTMDSTNLPERRRGKNQFLLLQILVLDLIGFSLIFPLVPHLLDYYVSRASTVPADFWLEPFINFIEWILPTHMQGENLTIVALGGVVTSAYSFLQFLISPYWGRLSDRIGRRPVLLFTSMGLAVSYLLWFLSTSFTSFLISRIIGGLMAGNLGVATAAMADMTDAKGRTRAMGMVGAAFGVGFVVGPAVGGLASTLDLTAYFPGASFLHPFSFCALVSFLMATMAAIRNYTSFEETLHLTGTQEQRVEENRSFFRLMIQNPGFTRTVLLNFLFLFVFSGFEFLFSFLFKLFYFLEPGSIGALFLYSGIILIIGQGLIVRKLTGFIKEKTILVVGILLMPIPLSLLSNLAPSVPLAMLAILPISLGASLVQPSLTGLASLLAPPEFQGSAMGIFRSAGSLARALGPLAGSVLFWKLGVSSTYLVLGFAMGVIFLFSMLLRSPAERLKTGET